MVLVQVAESFVIQRSMMSADVGTVPKSYVKSIAWAELQSDWPMLTLTAPPAPKLPAKLLVTEICCANPAAGKKSAATSANRRTVLTSSKQQARGRLRARRLQRREPKPRRDNLSGRPAAGATKWQCISA